MEEKKKKDSISGNSKKESMDDNEDGDVAAPGLFSYSNIQLNSVEVGISSRLSRDEKNRASF